MGKKNDIKITLRYHDRDDREHVLAVSRLTLVGIAALAATAAREAMSALEQKPLGDYLEWAGELADESALPEEQQSLALALETLRRHNDDYRAAHRLLHYLRPRVAKEDDHGTV